MINFAGKPMPVRVPDPWPTRHPVAKSLLKEPVDKGERTYRGAGDRFRELHHGMPAVMRTPGWRAARFIGPAARGATPS